MWGFFVIVPLMAAYVQPPLIEWLGPLPVIGALFQGRRSARACSPPA